MSQNSHNNQQPDPTFDRRTYLIGAIALTGTVLGASTQSVRAQESMTDPAPTDLPIGGGPHYADGVTRDDATTVVSTRDGLLEALDTATANDIVYIEDSAVIDLSGYNRISIPENVTLASGRGDGIESGAVIRIDTATARLFQITNDDVRITGLRFEGHEIGYFNPSGSVWYHDSVAIRVFADGCEIDNCQFFGWTHAAVGVGQQGDSPISSNAHIHHCTVHDNMMSGLGYGVVVYQGTAVIEHCYFNANRHSIAGGGEDDCSYEARYNIQGPDGLVFGFEMHTPGGGEIDIHHNTFELVVNRSGETTRAIAIRGTPNGGASIRSNWFYNPRDPGDNRFEEGAPIVQYDNDADGDSWDNVELARNHFGEDEPSPEIGHPREPVSDDPEQDGDVITIAGDGTTTQYEFTVDGEVEKSTAYNGTINSYDTIDGSTVTGRTTREPDSYRYRGEITTFDAEGSATVRINGDEVGPTQWADSTEVITVVGDETTTHYTIEVSGDLEKSTEYGGTINSYDTIDGGTATGRTTQEPDSYRFTGEIISVVADGPLTVLVNGEATDTSALQREYVVTITGTGETAHYEFTVDGEVEKSTAYDGTVNSYDTIDGDTVSGRTTREPDSYEITGDISEFDANGPVEVFINGEPTSRSP